MTRRVENNVTYTQTWDAENRLTVVTGTMVYSCRNCPAPITSISQFTYDGDGNRVLKVEISGTQIITTAYAGAIEVQITGTQRITKTYYSAGSQLIAMRQYTSPTESVLYFLHGDHLGSVSVTETAVVAAVCLTAACWRGRSSMRGGTCVAASARCRRMWATRRNAATPRD